MIKSLKYVCRAVRSPFGKNSPLTVNATQLSDGARSMTYYRAVPVWASSGAWMETVLSPDDFEINVFIKNPIRTMS